MGDNQISRRAKANFPTVLLTLLSIVQAFALELLWGHISEEAILQTLSFASVLNWLQISATLLGILLIWLIYTDLVLRLSWVPTTIDAIFPFLIGMLEFAQIGALGPATIGLWYTLLGILFGAMAWISQASMRRARQDQANADFFAHVSPATWRDHLVTAIPCSLLVLTGMGLWLTASQGWFAMIALIFAIALLIYQLWMSHVYTQRSYDPT